MPGAVAQRPVLPVAGDRAEDDLRVDGAHRLVADAEAVEHAGPEGLEHDVVLAHEREQQLAPGVLLEVDADRALVAVQREKQRRARARRRALDIRRRPADVVAHPHVLDLQHVGAVVGEQQRAEAAGQQPAEVEHAHAFQRQAAGAGHRGPDGRRARRAAAWLRRPGRAAARAASAAARARSARRGGPAAPAAAPRRAGSSG